MSSKIAKLGQFQFQLTIEESALNVSHFIINLVVNQSTTCAKHVELICYKLRQSLLQTGERITKCWQFYYKVGKYNFKLGQLHIITRRVEQLIHYKVGQSLLQGACNTKKATLLKSGTVPTNRDKSYYKVVMNYCIKFQAYIW